MGQYDFVPTIISRFAATTLYLYEVLITIDDEVTYVWSVSWTLPKALYVWVRYPGLISQLFSCLISVFPLSKTFCFDYGVYDPTWLLILSASTDALLVLRVLALVKGRRRLVVGLKFLYAGVYLVLTALLSYYYFTLFSVPGTPRDGTENLGCVQTRFIGTVPLLDLAAVLIPIACAPLLLLNTTFFVVVLCVVLPMVRRRGEMSPCLKPLFEMAHSILP